LEKILSKEVEQEANKLVEPHLFFAFSFLLIRDLEHYYNVFDDITAQYSRNSK